MLAHFRLAPALVAVAGSSPAATAQTLALDLNQSVPFDSTFSGAPTFELEADGVLWLTIQTESDGRELWTSDGTAAGTAMVADIYPGAASSSPESFVRLDANLLHLDEMSPAVTPT